MSADLSKAEKKKAEEIIAREKGQVVLSSPTITRSEAILLARYIHGMGEAEAGFLVAMGRGEVESDVVELKKQ